MRILVGIDGSHHSYDTLRYAINEAKLKNAKLSVVLSRDKEKTGADAIRDEKIMESAEKIIRKEGIEPDAHLLVRGLSPAVDIVRFAEENNCDQIIVGSRGLSGIARVLIGSVADEVVHKAHCPVTVYRK